MTEFTNNAVAPDEITAEIPKILGTSQNLPQAEGLSFTPLEAAFIRAQQVVIPFAFSVPFLIFTGINLLRGRVEILFANWWLALVYLGLVTIAVMMVPVVVRAKGYALRDHDIHYRAGVIWQKFITLPFNRIQHVEVESGPVERFFKLASVKIYTAGGGKTDMTIPGLGFAQATKLRDFIIAKAAASQTWQRSDALEQMADQQWDVSENKAVPPSVDAAPQASVKNEAEDQGDQRNDG